MTKHKVDTLLRALARKPVADELLRLGCRGDNNDSSCPIAQYLALHGIKSAVYFRAVKFLDRNGTVRETLMPRSVRAFVSDFTAGDHPELRRSES